MGEIVASTYEIIRHIGAGGGGNVYLAKHLRLNKNVVLKADKRRINARPELLRREVDVLKDLSHTYIPKVYDFFVENDTVYTVMDYINGESLDRPLKRGESFSQALVIKWAKQLLEALVYLHSPTHGDPPKGYVHSDIKPANIMRTPNGDICLIDFNITLALGELNFVGCSAGYASPEHYGLDYSGGLSTSITQTDSEAETVLLGHEPNKTGGKRTIIPDVRSDIFSTGATLYHLLSGRRPASDALEVVPLSEDEFSPQIVKIITKAMSPNPDLRYQTAQEMLDAFERLYDNDPRVKKLKRGFAIFELCMCALLIAGCFSAFTGLKRMQTSEAALRLAGSAQAALADGNAQKAVKLALQAIPEKSGIFVPPAPAEAECALADALGVYDLSGGFAAKMTIELDSEPLCIELSPSGDTLACITSGKAAVYNTDSGELIAQYPADRSALSEIHFLDDERIVFAGDGAIRVCDVYGGEVWSGNAATGISVSETGRYIAAVYRDENHASIYDADTGRLLHTVDFGSRKQAVAGNDIFVNPHDNLFAINYDGTQLAVSFSDGSLSVFNMDGSETELCVLDDTSGYKHFEGGFYRSYLAYSAYGSNGAEFGVADCYNEVMSLWTELDEAASCITNRSGVILEMGGILVLVSPNSGEQIPLAMTGDEVSAFAADGDCIMLSVSADKGGRLSFFEDDALLNETDCNIVYNAVAVSGNTAAAASTDSKSVRILKRKDCSRSKLLQYDPTYLHDEARVSCDGKTIMLFSINGFRLLSDSGEIISEVTFDQPDEIYDQHYVNFAEDDFNMSSWSWLEVTYYSGRYIWYSAADGSIIRDEMGEVPDRSLDEEFFTDKYRICSPLHGKPQVYDRQSGEFITELDEDAYLTYITKLKDGRIVAQYITTDGYYYGVLMNENFEKLANLPYLCDVQGYRAIFDYPTGNLRQTRFYNTQELVSAQKEGEMRNET